MLLMICYRDKESEEETGSVKNPASICGSPARTRTAESEEPSAGENDVDGAAVAPQVKLAADGSIILDEERYNIIDNKQGEFVIYFFLSEKVISSLGSNLLLGLLIECKLRLINSLHCLLLSMI